MKAFLCAALCATSFFLCHAGAYAQGKACLLEGTFNFGGESVVMSDCLENKGVPDSQFKQMCEGMSQFTVVDQTFKAKLTYLPACPAKAQGVCEGIFDMPLRTTTSEIRRRSVTQRTVAWRRRASGAECNWGLSMLYFGCKASTRRRPVNFAVALA